MMYLLALVFPWLAVLFCGKPIQALLNFIAWITLIGTIPAIVHGMLVVSSHHADKRQERLIRANQKETRRQTKELEEAARRRADAERMAAQSYSSR